MTQTLKFWQVDSFTATPFKGNPAAVVILSDPIPDAVMQNIAVEMNLSETAFIQLRPDGGPLLRWFTPTREIDLCGHATLASAHVYLTALFPDLPRVVFDTRFVGPLCVQRAGAGVYTMDFPSRPGEVQQIGDVPGFVLEALGSGMPVEVRKARDLMLVFADPHVIREMQPDFRKLMTYPDFVIVTSASDDPAYDFISRFFCADDGIAEDPVTGSAHCTLGPYWASRLGKTTLKAYQASPRGGELRLEVGPERILISGDAVTVMEGVLRV